MSRALEDGGSADLVRGAILRNNKADVVVALQDLVDTIVQEADTDDTLAGADHLGRAGAGLGVLSDVLVKLLEVLHSLVVSLHLDHSVDDELRGTCGVRVGQHDQALVLRLGQIVPGLGRLDLQALQLLVVDHEAQDALVDAEPVIARILVGLFQKMGSIDRVIFLQKTIGDCLVVRIGGAAEPDVSGGLSVLFLDLCVDFGSGKTLIDRLDSIKLFKVLAGSCQVFFLAGAVDRQGPVCLRGFDQSIDPLGRSFRFGFFSLCGFRCCRSSSCCRRRRGAAAAGCQTEDHQSGHQNR